MNDRLQQLYNICLNKSHHTHRFCIDKSVVKQFRDPSLSSYARMALRLKTVLGAEEPVIFNGQTIVFVRTVKEIPDIFTTQEWAEIRKKHFVHELGYVSNICADYENILNTGLESKREQAVMRLNTAKNERDLNGIEFISAAISNIEALYDLCDRYKTEAERVGNETAAKILSRIPRYGAESFAEAVQFFRILHFTLWAEGEYHNTIGRLDQYLYPYLKTDLEKGVIDLSTAYDMVLELFLSFNWDNDLYPGVQLGDDGQSLMLGGVDKDGNDAFNILSELCLKASCELKLIDPKINLRVSNNTPFERYREGTLLTKAGLGFPQYSNDDIVIPGLQALGYSLEDARNYSVAACWEYIVPGVAMDINNIAALSFPKIISKCTDDYLNSSADFNCLLLKVKEEIAKECDAICDRIKNIYFVPAPFYSVLMDGCIEKARDISLGNKYNNFGVHGTGIATAADSLIALKKHVFDDKTISADQMLNAIHHNFEGYEAILSLVRYNTSKMGDDCDEVDYLAAELLTSFADSLKNKVNERSGRFRAGTGSAMFYLRHAEEIGATPDGRRKNEPFGTNYSPSLYVKSKGPFSVIKSFTKPNLKDVINGGPLTMEFHSTIFDSQDGIDAVAGLVQTFIELGGHQLQLNSINRDVLIAARENPENYKNLIVRIWGWSAYFVELDKEYQDHLIKRQEYGGNVFNMVHANTPESMV